MSSYGTGKENYTFVCPDCGESLAVNASMRDALIEKGCVVCGAAVTAAAFTKASSADAP